MSLFISLPFTRTRSLAWGIRISPECYQSHLSIAILYQCTILTTHTICGHPLMVRDYHKSYEPKSPT